MATEELWNVYPGGAIPYRLALHWADARQRVLSSRRLRDYLATILQPGLAGDEGHLRWVATAPVDEVAAWAVTEHTRREDAINEIIAAAERQEERRAEL